MTNRASRNTLLLASTTLQPSAFPQEFASRTSNLQPQTRTTAGMAAKVLVIGATNGRFAEAFAKVTLLHSKNNFSLALLLGDLFSAPNLPSASPSATRHNDDEDIQRLLRGEIAVPLPIYFGLGRHSLPQSVRERLASSSGEVCENLFFLGKKTVLNTSDGIRIVALGGRLDATPAPGKPESIGTEADAEAPPSYTAQDAKALKGANTTDLLVTFEWPEGAQTGSKVPGALPEAGSRTIAELAAALRPRYHFVSGGDTFWEREPYRNSMRENEGQADVKVTRFLGIADWGNAAKAKALYAFSINPKDAVAPVPLNATGCPYKFDAQRGQKRGHAEATGGDSFFWGNHTGGDQGDRRGRGKGGRKQKGPPPGPESCFFCLSYSQLEKHLIVSIGNDAYLTTAKGPLTNPDCNPPTLPFSSHILIIPLTHTAVLQTIDDPDSRASTIAEMHQYRRALAAMLKSRGCGAVTFEIARERNVHHHWQVVPVPLEKLKVVEQAFRDGAKADTLGEFQKRNPDGEDGDYFRLWIDGEEVSGDEEGLVMGLRHDEYFDLQFGRRVLAKVLGLNTVHWKDCVLPFQEEVKDAAAFKEAFKPFDFSL